MTITITSLLLFLPDSATHPASTAAAAEDGNSLLGAGSDDILVVIVLTRALLLAAVPDGDGRPCRRTCEDSEEAFANVQTPVDEMDVIAPLAFCVNTRSRG